MSIIVSPIDRAILSGGGLPLTVSVSSTDDIYYTLDGTVPTIDSTLLDVLSGSGSIDIPYDHTLLSVMTVDLSGNESLVERFQYDNKVEIVLHPQKEVYNIGDVITATLNVTTSGGSIQTYENYRWINEQVEHRFDPAEDDDRFNGPRPTFNLNKIGTFRVKCFYKDDGFKSKRVDKLFEVYPVLKVKYKGLQDDVGRLYEPPTVTEKDSNVPFLGKLTDLRTVDFSGDKPIPLGGLPKT